jgi:hypothetical protein
MPKLLRQSKFSTLSESTLSLSPLATMASETDLKELQDQPNRCRQDDHLNREQEENDLHKIAEMQELFEKLQKEIAEKDAQIADSNKLIEQLKSRRIPSTPPHHSSLTSDSKAFDGQSCTPRAAELTSSRPLSKVNHLHRSRGECAVSYLKAGYPRPLQVSSGFSYLDGAPNTSLTNDFFSIPSKTSCMLDYPRPP